MKALIVVLATISFTIANPSIDEVDLNSKTSTSSRTNVTHNKIVGGDLAEIKDFPWQVAILRNGILRCGGVLVGRDVVLTSAHCLVSKKITKVSELSVRSGSSFHESGGLVVAARSFIVHPSYKKNHCETCLYYFDIAVVHLAGESVSPGLPASPIALWDVGSKFDAGTVATVSGWGTTLEEGWVSFQLRRVDVPVIDSDKCSLVYGPISANRIICAGYDEGGKDACQGDSGGPFVIENKLAGIISLGLGCARAGTPGVYTSVPGFREWIWQNAENGHVETYRIELEYEGDAVT